MPSIVTFLRSARGRLAIFASALVIWAGHAAASSLMAGGYTSQPIGHFEFCKRLPAECSKRTLDRGPQRVSDAMLNKIQAVNLSVNRRVRPVSDLDQHGVEEFWSYPVSGMGDCEDYALEKRRLLSGRGFDLSNLLITVVRKPDGEGHAVLTVRTDRGDLILDNLRNDVRTWDRTGYKFLKRQASDHTGRWVSLHGDRNMLVGAVR